MTKRLQFGLVVSLISVLIWVWAEGESLSSREVWQPIEFADDAGDLRMRADSATWRKNVRLRLEGSRTDLDRVSKLMNEPIKLRPGEPGVPDEPGERVPLNMLEAVRGNDRVKQLGLNVVEVEPPIVPVEIVRLVTRDLKVRVVPPTGVQLTGEPTPNPAQVTVSCPESFAASLPESVDAIIEKQTLQGLRDDGQLTVLALLHLRSTGVKELMAANDLVRVSHSTVNVTLRLAKNVVTRKRNSVPVWVSIPPTEGTKWDIEILTPFLTDVELSGPAELVDGMPAEALIAEVRLSSDDLEQGVTTKKAIISGLPAGVSASGFDANVSIKVTRRIEQSPPPTLPLKEPGAGDRAPAGNDSPSDGAERPDQP